MSISKSVRTLASHACAPGKPGRKPGLSVKPAPAPPGDRKSPMSISKSVRTLASHACAPGKPGRKPGLSVKPAGREYPCPLAGRSRRPSWPPFTARPLRFALLASLASGARSWARASPTSSTMGRCRNPGTEVNGPARRLVPRPRPPPSLPAGDRMSPMSTSRSMRTLASHASAQGKPGRTPGLSVKPEVANEYQQNATNLWLCGVLPQGKPGRKPGLSVKPEVANEHQQNATNLGFVAFCPRKAGQDARSFREARSRQ